MPGERPETFPAPGGRPSGGACSPTVADITTGDGGGNTGEGENDF